MTLLSQLQAAESGSRGLDGLIARDIEGWLPYFDLEGNDILMWPEFGGHWHQPGDPCDHNHALDGRHGDPPDYTTSIDTALALVERVLPEANCYGFDKTPKEFEAYVCRDCVSEGHWAYSGIAATPALAICIALIRAREAEDG